MSHVSGGIENLASGKRSSVSGGNQNIASGEFSSVSGGTGNIASGETSSILGGMNKLTADTNEIYPKESTSSGDGTSPFTCTNGWCTSKDNNYFQFSKGIVIGQKAVDEDCIYGDGILSVDANGSNCPSGQSSVTFGTNNKASSGYSSVSGGSGNEASGVRSSILGGLNVTTAQANEIYPKEST